MNPVDIAVLVIIGLCVLWGFYRGFVQTLLNLVGGVVSFVVSFLLYPSLSSVLMSNNAIRNFIQSVTDSGSLLGNANMSGWTVSSLSASQIAEAVEKANLPQPLGSMLKTNLANQVFSTVSDGYNTVGSYVNQTVQSVSINVICFILCFILSFIVITIIINFIRSVFRMPVLRTLDGLAGGVMGFGVAVLLCFVLFTLMPLLESVIPVEGFRELVDTSKASGIFSNSGLIVSIMNKKIL